MKGYKGFNSDLSCRGFQYEIGKTYEMSGLIALCSRGFHFCQTLTDCFDYYDKHSSRFCEIETGELVVKGSDKCCTDKITIVRELSRIEINRAIYGYGNGYGDGYGDGYGYGYGNGNGYGDGYGDGYGYGYGNGDGNGDGNSYGYGNGYGNGYSYGYGNGYGDGYGDGYGYGYGNGDGNGDGNSYGYGNGYGDGYIQKILIFKEIAV